MADFSKISKLINGIQRHVDFATNSFVVQSIKLTDDGGSTSSELTKTILDNLIGLQNGTDFSDGTNSHTHDGRYFTESEISSNSNGEGASLVGIEDASSQFTATDVEGALDEAMDAAQAAQADATQALSDAADAQSDIDGHLDGGASKHDASEIDYERADGSKKNIQASSDDIENAVTDLDDAIGALDQTPINYSPSDPGIVADHLAGIDSQLGVLSSTSSNFEFKNSVLDVQEDNTLDPGASPTTGDRYLILDSGNLHANFGTIAGVADNDIVEYDGADFIVSFSPTDAGPFVSSDADQSGVYQWGGAAWAFKYFEATTASLGLEKVGFDIRIASSAAGTGIQLSAGVLSLDFSEFDTDDVNEGSTNLYFTDTRAKTAAVDDTAYNESSWDGVTDQAPSKNAIRDKIESLTSADLTHTQNDTNDWTIGDGSSVAAHLDELADRLTAVEADNDASKLQEIIVAGESYSAGLNAVRFAKGAETAGRAYKADIDASSSDDFHVMGLANPGGAVSAGQDLTVVKMGPLTVSSHGFTLGMPLYLDAAGAVTETPPSGDDEAVVKVGMVRDANTIEVQIQIMGVN